MNQGADVIFPVAGGAGQGAAASAAASGGKVSVIWVDTDGCVSDAKDCARVPRPASPRASQRRSQKTVEDAAAGTFAGGSYSRDLSNGGTGLVPVQDFWVRRSRRRCSPRSPR